MQVQSINSNINRVKFGSEEQFDKDLSFINLDDIQLSRLSLLKAKEEQGKKRNPLKSLLITLPLVDIASKFIMQSGGIVHDGNINIHNRTYEKFKILPGSLSKKMSAAGHAAMKWGGVLLVLGIYNSIKDAVVSKSEKLQNIEKNHPFASMLADIGLFLGSLSLAEKGANKIAEKMVIKTPDLLEKVGKKVSSAKVWLDKTSINTKVLPKVSELFGRLSKKSPLLATFGLVAVAAAPYIVIVNSLFKISKQNRDFNNNYLNNYRNMKEGQLQLSKTYLNKVVKEFNT
ncbi:MAG TPA: hypothetical protein PKI94_06530 [Candidatus Gastranaerophilaceae bacterium]|nr:hypothetical protein [Candidatus Gastranaerophilaceae bacterium]